MDPQTERTIGKLVKNIKKLAEENDEYRAELKQLKHDYRQMLLGYKDFAERELRKLGTDDAHLCK